MDRTSEAVDFKAYALSGLPISWWQKIYFIAIFLIYMAKAKFQ